MNALTQHRRGDAHGLRPLACAAKSADSDVFARENPLFAHPLVGEEAVGRLRVRPVLASQRYRLSEAGILALDQLTNTTVQPAVAKTAARKLLVQPPFLHDRHLFVPDSVPDKEPQFTPSMQ